MSILAQERVFRSKFWYYMFSRRCGTILHALWLFNLLYISLTKNVNNSWKAAIKKSNFFNEIWIFHVFILGTPVILSANTSMSGTNDHIIHVKLELISFPDPTCKIRVEDDKHSGFIAKNCKLWTTVLAFKQIDKYIDVPGYILSFDIESIDSSFNESPELRIFVSNKEGTRKYEIRSNN